jgi:hypothetical protein
VSIQDLQQNPQDTSNFYLANIYQATINPNELSSLPTSPPPFTPPNYAVWVNALWFLSLVISITCALLATLLQQWARRYLKVTQPRYSPHKRARIRAFFAEGVDKFLLPWAVEALPTMLHLSLFLFFAGIAVFLWNVNLTIFKLMLSWVGLCTALYGCITFIPIFRHDSPYHTPLSLPTWHIVTGIQLVIFRVLHFFATFPCFNYKTWYHIGDIKKHYRKLLVQGMQKTAEETAFNSPPEIDTRAFLWTLDSLDEDHELERFFSGLPGFRSSKVIKDPLPRLTSAQQMKFLNTLIGLSDRTASSDLLPEPVKIRRIVICERAIGPANIPRATQQVLDRIASEGQYGLAQSTAFSRLVRSWNNGGGRETTMIIRAIVSGVVARAQRRDDVWFTLASDDLGVPSYVLRNHATHGEDLSLAILIHCVRQQFSLCKQLDWPLYEFSKVLEAASNFNVIDTSPELQHDFCALWNEIVHAKVWIPEFILRPIRNIYLTLHLHTDSAPTHFSASTGNDDPILLWRSVYPLCKIPGHHPDSTARIHEVSASTAIPRAFPDDNNALIPTSLPDAPSPSVRVPVHVDEHPMDVVLLENTTAHASLYHAHQTVTESAHDYSTLPDPAAAGAARDNPSARTMYPTAHATSTSTPSFPSPVTFQNNAGLLVHSGAPEIPTLTSPEQVLGDVTGLSLLSKRRIEGCEGLSVEGV